MTISKIYIGAFGRLKDYTLELNDGFNVIYGENENGKTTMMSFIKMMFYGGASKGQLQKAPRKKYQPWSGEAMGGRVYFEHNGRRYCLEREFKGSDATDKVTLRDLDLGISQSVSGDIGSRFFGIGADAFERSVFIGQAGGSAKDDAAEGELNAKLSNLALTGDEDTSYQTVYSRLDAAEQKLMSKRHVGIYDKGVQQLEQLRTALERADGEARRREALIEKRNLLAKQLTEIKKQYDTVRMTVDSEKDVRSAGKLREFLDTKEQLDRLNETLKLNDGKLVDDLFLGKVNFCLSKFETELRRADEKREEAEQLKKTIELSENPDGSVTTEHAERIRKDITELQGTKEALNHRHSEQQELLNNAQERLVAAQSKKKAFHPLLLAAGILVVLLAVVFALIYQMTDLLPFNLSGGLAAFGIVSLIMSFIFRPADKVLKMRIEGDISAALAKTAEFKSGETEIQEKINQKTAELNVITAALNTDQAVRAQQKAELLQRLQTAQKAQSLADTAQAELMVLFSRYRDISDFGEIKEHMTKLTAKAEEQKQLKLRLKYLSADLDGIAYGDAEKKLVEIGNTPTVADTDFEAAKIQLETLNKQGTSLSSDLSGVNAELKSSFRDAKDPESLQRQIDELQQRLTAQKQFCDAAQIAKKVLEDSFAEVRRGYGSVLEQKTLALFSRLTGGRYGAVSISKSLKLEAEQSGSFGTKDIDYLSSGTADQAYFSLRLALSSLISGDEALPVLLDDVLAQYDDTRARQAIEFLKEYSENAQILLFTCHCSVCETAQKLGINVFTLSQSDTSLKSSEL